VIASLNDVYSAVWIDHWETESGLLRQ